MYKYDLHVHTSETSSCGRIKAEMAVEMYKEAGYAGIVITDHYYEGYFNKFDGLSWNEKINNFFTGYKIASKRGAELGLSVFPGIEIRFTENPNDYLVYGINENFLLENPELHKMGLKKFKKFIKNKNILIFQAHPYREGMTVVLPDLLDGVEVYNGNPRHDSKNDLALKFAVNNKLRMISGSDFHQADDVGSGGIIIPYKINTEDDLMKILTNKTTGDFNGYKLYKKI